MIQNQAEVELQDSMLNKNQSINEAKEVENLEEFGGATYKNTKEFAVDTYREGEEYVSDIYEGTKDWVQTTGSNIIETGNWLGNMYESTEELVTDVYSNVREMVGDTSQTLESLAVNSYESIKQFVSEFGEKQADNSIVLESENWHSELKENHLAVTREDGSLMLSGDGQTFSEFSPTASELEKVAEISDFLSQESTIDSELMSQQELEM